MNRKVIKKVALYARVSTEEQAKEGFSIPAQLDELRRYAERHEYEIVQEYVDEGVSGKSIAGRPQMKRLLKDASLGIFNAVIVYKIDRISRKLKDALEIAELLDQTNVSLLSLNENFDMSTPTGKVLFQLLGSFAEFERNNIVSRVRMGMKERAQQGKFNGGICLGYDSREKELVINQQEAIIVKQIFQLADEGHGYKAITNRINEMGYRTKRGKQFSINGIKDILDNPIYIGKIRWNQMENWSEKRRSGKNKEPVLVDGQHQPIIDIVQWNRVQAMRKKRSHKPARSSQPYILSGLLRCPKCGYGMVPSRSKGSMGITYRYYVCGKFHNKGASACSAYSIRADYAEHQVIERITQLVSEPYILKRLVEQINNERANVSKPMHEERTALQMKINQLEKKIDNLTNALAEDPALLNILSPKIKATETERLELQARMEQLNTTLSSCDTDPIDYDSLRILLSDFQKVLTKLEPEQQKALLRLVIKDITVSKEAPRKNAPRQVERINLHFDFTVESLQNGTGQLLGIVYDDFIESLPDRALDLFKYSGTKLSDALASLNILPLTMIRFPPTNPKPPINLLQQHQPHQLMRKRHLRKRQQRIRPLQHRIGQPERSADHERHLAAPVQCQPVQLRRQLFR